MRRAFGFRLLAMLLVLLLTLGSAVAEVAGEAPVEYSEELGEIDLPMEPEAAGEVEAAEAHEAEASGDAGEVEAPAEASGDAGQDEAPAEVSEDAEQPEASGGAEQAEAPAEDPSDEAPAMAKAAQGSGLPYDIPAALTLGAKEKYRLADPSTGLTFETSNKKYVRVEADGVIVARRRGVAVVTASLNGQPVATCEVTVMKSPSKVYLPEKSIVISAGERRPFAATLSKGAAGTITYTSDNPAVLAVDAAGNLRGVSGGSATLTAQTYNGRKAKCAVRVLGGPAPTWVALNETDMMLPVKGKSQLTASFDPGHDAIVTYATSNKKIATVNDAGLVTGKRAGQAVITATTHNGLTATCKVTVYILPKRISLNVKKLSLPVNNGYQLTATITKNSVSTITWSSSNPVVATVDQNGLVAALNQGNATITATTVNGKQASCKVTVLGETVYDERGEVLYYEETESLKVKMVKDHGMFLTYLWVKDPSRQLRKHYGANNVKVLAQEAIELDKLQDRIVIAFNASAPVNEQFRPDWNRDPNYRHREPSPLMICNGKVLVNDPTKSINKYLYWLDGNYRLCHTDITLDKMTVEERAALYKRVIDSGASNTMIWQPVLISNYKPTVLSPEFLRRKGGQQKKQALCQYDEHNFLLVTSSDAGRKNYLEFQQYLMGLGVKTAVEFDAGASTSLIIKEKYNTSMRRFIGCGRTLSMVMYFTELP